MYHYLESGLPNIWLKNGYVEHETNYGPGISIHNVDGLHDAIGMAIASNPGVRLTQSEIKFLRKELGLSQKRLAELIGTSEQTVSLWERGNQDIPKTPDLFLRAIYLNKAKGDQKLLALLEMLKDIDAHEEETLSFAEEDEHWMLAA